MADASDAPVRALVVREILNLFIAISCAVAAVWTASRPVVQATIACEGAPMDGVTRGLIQRALAGQMASWPLRFCRAPRPAATLAR
jgi:hypothetical protein